MEIEQNLVKCLRCGSAMVKGVLIDQSESARMPTYWMKGKPSISRNSHSFDLDYHELMESSITVTTFRCERCGYLESYAV